jgi:hypothetical protein
VTGVFDPAAPEADELATDGLAAAETAVTDDAALGSETGLGFDSPAGDEAASLFRLTEPILDHLSRGAAGFASAFMGLASGF